MSLFSVPWQPMLSKNMGVERAFVPGILECFPVARNIGKHLFFDVCEESEWHHACMPRYILVKRQQFALPCCIMN